MDAVWCGGTKGSVATTGILVEAAVHPIFLRYVVGVSRPDEAVQLAVHCRLNAAQQKLET